MVTSVDYFLIREILLSIIMNHLQIKFLWCISLGAWTYPLQWNMLFFVCQPYLLKYYRKIYGRGKYFFMSWKKWQNYQTCFLKKNIVYDDSEGTMISNPSGLDTRWYVYAVI